MLAILPIELVSLFGAWRLGFFNSHISQIGYLVMFTIERLWHEKLAAALEAGKDARHCHSTLCMTEQHPVEACGCGCDGCELVLDLLIAAQREITGRE